MSGDYAASVFPESLMASREHPALRYRLVNSHFAVHGGDHPLDATRAVLHFPAENIVVHATAQRGSVASAQAAPEYPVYESTAGGTLCVPTGWIYIRFAKDARLQDHASALEGAGFRIVRTLAYASYAGWVVAATGGIAASLNGIGRLDALPGIEEVAPQMLSQASRKD